VLGFPSMTSNLHHEVELVVAIGVSGKEIHSESALEHVWGYGVGIDMTRRDLQAQAKKLQRPWSMSKGFDRSAPVSALRSASEIGHPSEGRIWLKVNGEIRQDGDLNMQIWNVGETISHLSSFVELEAGDLLMTGTPAGVGPCSTGDTLEGYIEGIGQVTVSYAEGRN
jgi:fumarylpyruvate hydrolase